MIDDATLAKLEEVEKKATDGPWDYDGQHNEIIAPTTDAEQYWLIVSECRSAPDQTAERDRWGHHYDANYDLIVRSRNAMPDLLETIRVLRAALENVAIGCDEALKNLRKGNLTDVGRNLAATQTILRAALQEEEAERSEPTDG